MAYFVDERQNFRLPSAVSDGTVTEWNHVVVIQALRWHRVEPP